jgi:hypothetical protein
VATVDDVETWLASYDAALKGVYLHRRPYFQWALNWDHDHCEFCRIAFVVKGDASAEPPNVTEGWTTDDESDWICNTCFDKYRERFNWKVRNRLSSDRPDTGPPTHSVPIKGVVTKAPPKAPRTAPKSRGG